MICQSYDDYEKEVATVEALLRLRVDGIIASFAKETKDFDHFLKAKEKGIPVILFDRSNDELEVSHVVVDDFLGAFKATEHLIQQGCKRIAHLLGHTAYQHLQRPIARLQRSTDRSWPSVLMNHLLLKAIFNWKTEETA